MPPFLIQSKKLAEDLKERTATLSYVGKRRGTKHCATHVTSTPKSLRGDKSRNRKSLFEEAMAEEPTITNPNVSEIYISI